MKQSKIYTLWDLLTNNVDIFKLEIPYGIEIPMIQRDYAQGRDEDKPRQIRKRFLSDIHTQLLAFQQNDELAEPLEMDFIYGYIASGRFIPLDGQQRLTTLYLVYWFVFFKDRAILEQTDVFSRLSYKSRISSREFFDNLNEKKNIKKIYERIDVLREEGEDYKLTEVIFDQSWFQKAWENDPTIKSVKLMLDCISDKFSDISVDTLLNHRALGFYLIAIPDNGFGDSLYIKMNARGKGLTDFENLKALLEGRIHAVDRDLHAKFAHAIDKSWLDTVWLYARNVSSLENRSKAAGEYLLSMIALITELVYYKESNSEKPFALSEEVLLSLYGKRMNICFLINALAGLCSHPLDEYENYFSKIYSEKNSVGRVRQVGMGGAIELMLTGQTIDNSAKLLFFAWLIYVNGRETLEVSENMKDYLRICRNYINSVNQKSRKSFSLTSDIRTENFGEILNIFSAVLDYQDVYGRLNTSKVSAQNYIRYEIIKARCFHEDPVHKLLIHKLEDNNVFRGLLFNIDLARYNTQQMERIVKDFLALMALDDREIIRLLISLGFEGALIASKTNIGDMYFRGGKDRWHRIMASPDGEIKPAFLKLFELFINRNGSETIENFVGGYWKIIKDELQKNAISWYLLSYPSMLNKALYTIIKKEWSIPRIELFDISSLNGYHCNPFVYELRDRAEIRPLISYNMSFAQYSDYARLELTNGLSLSQANYSWILHNAAGQKGVQELIDYFGLEDLKNGEYRFVCDNLVEDVIPFVQACAELVRAKIDSLEGIER